MLTGRARNFRNQGGKNAAPAGRPARRRESAFSQPTQKGAVLVKWSDMRISLALRALVVTLTCSAMKQFMVCALSFKATRIMCSHCLFTSYYYHY